MGVLTYVLLTGRQPFSSPKTDDPMVVMRRIVDDSFIVKFPPYISPAAKDFVLRLLDRKPTRRLGMLQASRSACLCRCVCQSWLWAYRRFGERDTTNLLSWPPQGKANDVKQHRWFENFDWEALAARKLAAPRKPRDDAAKRIRELVVSAVLLGVAVSRRTELPIDVRLPKWQVDPKRC